MFEHLLLGRLTYVHNGGSLQMFGRDLLGKDGSATRLLALRGGLDLTRRLGWCDTSPCRRAC